MRLSVPAQYLRTVRPHTFSIAPGSGLFAVSDLQDSLNEALRGELSLLQQHAAAPGMAGGGPVGGSNGAAGSQMAGNAHAG